MDEQRLGKESIENVYHNLFNQRIDLAVATAFTKQLPVVLEANLEPRIDASIKKHVNGKIDGLAKAQEADRKTLLDYIASDKEWKEEDREWKKRSDEWKETIKPIERTFINWTGFYKVIKVVGAGAAAVLGFALMVSQFIRLFGT